MKLKSNEVLVLKRCKESNKAYDDFVYPLKGIVEAKDWNDKKECGGGLHGWTLGFENYSDTSLSGNFVVILVNKKDGYVELGDKVKFKKGKVVLNTPDVHKAHELMLSVYPTMKLHWGNATQGDYSTATQGHSSTAKQGYRSTATQGDYSTATQGHSSTAKQGHSSTATQGDYSTATQGDSSTATQGDYSTAKQGYRSTATQGYRSTATVFGDEYIYRNSDKLCAVVMFYNSQMHIFRGDRDFSPNETIKIQGCKITHRYTDTPDTIKKLEPHEVFIFGSNLNGNHAGGAAKLAQDKFDAVSGQGEGLQGQSYAFPTLDKNMQKVSIDALKESVAKLYKCASENTTNIFFLTKVGCGIAGFTEDEIKPLFTNAPANIIKPKGW